MAQHNGMALRVSKNFEWTGQKYKPPAVTTHCTQSAAVTILLYSS